MAWDICVFAAATAFFFLFLFCLFKVTETPDEMPAVEINLALTLVGQLAWKKVVRFLGANAGSSSEDIQVFAFTTTFFFFFWQA